MAESDPLPSSMVDQLVEGFGDEVILALTTFLVLCATVIALHVCSRFRRRDIHPDHIAQVNEAREQLGIPVDADQIHRHADDNDPCPICLGQPQFVVMTNCGHVFCGLCILEYYGRAANLLRAILCPVCRQSVSILLPDFTEADRAHDEREREDILGRINDYNRRFSGVPRTAWEYIADAPALLSYLWHQLWTGHYLLLMFRVRVLLSIVVMVVYLLSPLDIIPEAVFGLFGLLDDLVLVVFVIMYLTVLTRVFVVARARGGVEE
eukprot:scpid88833/ scgid5395/ RING finger protein 170; Putative LAG1-interacting protein